MKRHPKWEPRLAALLDERRSLPFEWGMWDCAQFGFAVISAVTGEDVGGRWRGRYRTELGAGRVLARDGFSDVTAGFDSLIGPRVAPLMARRGDLVTNGESIGIMWSAGGPVALFLGVPGALIDDYETGLVSVPVSAVTSAWRLG